MPSKAYKRSFGLGRAAGRAAGGYQASLFKQSEFAASSAYEDWKLSFDQSKVTSVVDTAGQLMRLGKNISTKFETKKDTTAAIKGLKELGWDVEEQEQTLWESAFGKEKEYKMGKTGTDLQDTPFTAEDIRTEYDLARRQELDLPSSRPALDFSWMKKEKPTPKGTHGTGQDPTNDPIGGEGWYREKAMGFRERQESPKFAEDFKKYNPDLLKYAQEYGWQEDTGTWL